jgi:TolA-binding protein
MLVLSHRRTRRSPLLTASLLALAGWLLSARSLPAQVTPEQQADMLLTAGQKAYNDKNYPFARDRFREFLQKFGGNKNAPLARYGLALALIDGPDKDYQGAVENLQPLAGAKEMPEHPFVLYYLGLSRRGLGVRALAQAVAKPQEAQQYRQFANQRFDEAARDFGAASAAFAAQMKEVPADAKELPVELEWAARARADQAEMLLRLQKPKEAQAAAAPFLKDPVFSRSKYRTQGLYFHGFACLLLGEIQAAGRSLTMKGVSTDPVFGTHARYLLARVHHQEGERAEAAGHYEGVIADYAKQKQTAQQTLQRPDLFKNDPDEKARLEAIVKGPPPDHVASATLYLGVLRYEDGQFGEAASRLAAFVKDFPQSPLAAEAQLRLGFCQVQLKQWAEALKTLQPLADKEPRLNDQAWFWMAKAHAGAAAEQTNPQAQEQGYKTALETFRKAIDRAGQLAGTNPEAKTRRGDMLLEMADTQQAAKLFKDAATTYNQLVNEKLLPAREEEIVQRQATALHLAGDYAEAEKVCQRFLQAYPKSPLVPAVLFRQAENAYFQALAIDKNPNAPNRAQELARLNDEVIKRYQVIVDKYPEFPHANLARHGVGMGYYRKGDLEKAKEVLESIPAQDRTGELALVPYVLADCLMRQAPTKADDALEAGRLEEMLKAAAEQLEAFVGGNAASPEAPDALLKLGLCHQRLAGLLAQPQERNKELGIARAAYERLMQQFPKHDLQPQAVLERARCIAQMGDPNGAINELRRFTNDPLKQAPVAPMGLLQLATLLRGQNKAQEAADVLAQARQQHEANLQKDPARAGWVALLQYHQGVALREAGKRAEARNVLNLVVQQAAGKPEGFEAALRWGQCLREEGLHKIDAAQKRLATPNLKPDEIAAANRDLEAGQKDLRDTIQFLEGQAEQSKQKQPTFEGRARMHYEAAWCARSLAESEVAVARHKLQQEQWQKLKDEAAKKTPPGRTPPAVPAPEIALAAVPLQPSEQKARANYQALIAAFPERPLAGDARLELAELLADRTEYDAAIKLLKEGLDKEPPQELTDKMRLRLGACLVAKGDTKGGLAHFKAIAGNPKSPLAAQGHYRAGECLLQMGDAAEAVKHLAVFRDQGPFQNLPGLTDRALLRLGHALDQLKQWDASRQAFEQVANRFPNGPWAHEARYGMGWALQNAKQYDQAVNAYNQVVAGTVTEIAAKAQLQIGLCRMEQKRYPEAATALLVVPFTYDYPEWSAAALYEAHLTFTEMKQPEQATRLLRRLIKDHPDSKWAQIAKEKLEAAKGG